MLGQPPFPVWMVLPGASTRREGEVPQEPKSLPTAFARPLDGEIISIHAMWQCSWCLITTGEEDREGDPIPRCSRQLRQEIQECNSHSSSHLGKRHRRRLEDPSATCWASQPGVGAHCPVGRTGGGDNHPWPPWGGDTCPHLCLSSEQCLALRTETQQLKLSSLIGWHVAAGRVCSLWGHGHPAKLSRASGHGKVEHKVAEG